jgi:uncharacterized membrane protein YecN with MAPEG domain
MGDIPVPISALYAALQALIAIGLVVPVGQLRGRTNVSLGSGGNPEMEAAIRRHQNWTEHVPIALLLIALLELNVHPIGIDAAEMRRPLRGIGAFATLLVTLVAAVALLLTAF